MAKKMYVYLVKHTMFGDKTAIVWVCKTAERAQRCCEVIASDHGKRTTDHIWNSDKTKYFLEQTPDRHFFEIHRWEVD